ncbi:MAG: outer membrane lipoprotein-sorting protein [Dasania sp.]|jgi:outer membrane lipoprotein-sorting protein
MPKKIIISTLIAMTLILLNMCFSVNASDSALPKITAYLNKMKSATGRFTQIGPDGVISQGDFALRKPGKMYFDYEAPTPLKIVSDGFWVSVEDTQLKTRDRYPLSETPLSILLKEKADFLKTDYKISVHKNENSHLITASDPKHPDRGEITIAFSKAPIALTHWVITDAQGLKTIVNLQNINLNVPTKNDLFFIPTDTGNINGNAHNRR